MKKYVHVDETGRISATFENAAYADPDRELLQIDFPEDFDLNDQYNYIIESGSPLYSPRPLTDFEKESLKAEKRQEQFYKAVQKLVKKAGFTADEALEFGYLYPDWGGEDAKYKKGELYVYEDSVYCCLKNHQQKHGIEIADPEYWELVGPIE
jgi:hypothetical protein